jgi:pSer/pThr/pTyr-binding forkhead associated (FHA) protein
MFKLLISDDEGKQTTVPLVRDEVTIGRKEGNTIRLTERNVSRRHARLQKQNGHYLLHDLGSYNGIVINGQRLLDSQALKHGDQILIGDYKLAILEEATSQIQAPPPGSNGAHDTLDALPPAAPPAPAPSPIASAPPSAPPAAPTQRVSTPPLSPPPTASATGEVPDEIRNMRLVFLAPAGAPAPYGLDHLPIILGRSEVADISLPFSSISREHARLTVQGGSLVIEDLGSSNGVTVNGDKVQRAVITIGDHVALGVVEFRVAKRGEQTVVMNVPTEPAAKSRSALGIVLALAGLGVIGGGVAIALRGNGSNAAAGQTPAASAPQLTTPTASATGPATPTVPAVAPAQTAPENPMAVAPAPQPQPTAPQPAAPVAAPPPVVAMAETPTQQPEANEVDPTPAPTRNSGSSEHHSRSSSSNSSNSARVAAAAPAQSNPTPPPPNNSTASSTRSSAGSNGGGSGSTAAAATAGGGEQADPLAAARACRADNACVVAALEGRSRTEQEVGLLAVTYRLMGNRAAAIRTMNRYLQRWPAGPRAEGFHNYIEAE